MIEGKKKTLFLEHDGTTTNIRQQHKQYQKRRYKGLGSTYAGRGGSMTDVMEGSAHKADTGPSDHTTAVPIVLCPGFLGPAKDEEGGAWRGRSRVYEYWGAATRLGTSASPVYCVWPGGLSSLHDRACEIFFQIKGGCVDYGAAHAAEFGHARFGRTHRGLHPAWSAASPIHVVGHSLGGTTVRMLQVMAPVLSRSLCSCCAAPRALPLTGCALPGVRLLQHLLHVRAFPGHDTSADWIVSLTAISAPLNGELAAYALGEREASAPAVVSLSPGSFLGSLVHVLAFTGWRIGGFDLGLDQWELSWRGTRAGRTRGSWRESSKCLCAALKTLTAALFIKSPISESEDNAAYDTSIHAMAKCNARMGVAHDCTFYLSLVSTGEDANEVPRCADPRRLGEWLQWLLLAAQFCFRRVFLSLICFITHCRRYRELEKSLANVEGFEVAHYRGRTDGLCSVFTQSCPRVGVALEPWRAQTMPDTAAEMKRGVWYIETHGQDHMGLVPFPVSEQVQRETFLRLFRRLRSLPPGGSSDAAARVHNTSEDQNKASAPKATISGASAVQEESVTECVPDWGAARQSPSSSEASDTETDLSHSYQYLDLLLAETQER